MSAACAIEPERGFPPDEFRERVRRAQTAMQQTGVDALLVTTEADFRYFTGFLTRFWESPTRPWFVIVPATRPPIAVIPSIGEALMRTTWIADVRTWRAPTPEDDGVSLLGDALREVAGPDGVIATPMGLESHLRMPLQDFTRLSEDIAPIRIGPDLGLMRALREIKSEREIAKIRHACGIADRAFMRVTEIVDVGVALDEVARRFQMLCLEEGADWVPYLACPCGRGGYGDVISPATGRPLAVGDVLMLDTGLVHDGYFCDFDRNFAIGDIADDTRNAHRRLIEAVDAAMAIARPGRTAADLFHAMDAVVARGTGKSAAGRLGHGLGMQLTEGASLIPSDQTVLKSGMVLTLEPGIEIDHGRILVHEENIVIGDRRAEYLSTPAGPEMVVVGGHQ